MKIYKHTPRFIIRVQAKADGAKAHSVSFCQTTLSEVYDFCKVALRPHLDYFAEAPAVRVMCREHMYENGGSRSFTIRGLTPEEVIHIITTAATASTTDEEE